MHSLTRDMCGSCLTLIKREFRDRRLVHILINFSDPNCVTRYNLGETGQNLFGHIDVLINVKYVFVNANYTCTF